MLQESVYVKLAPNGTSADTIIDNVRKNIPNEGLVQAIKVTEKQYSNMEFLLGDSNIEILSTSDRLVIL